MRTTTNRRTKLDKRTKNHATPIQAQSYDNVTASFQLQTTEEGGTQPAENVSAHDEVPGALVLSTQITNNQTKIAKEPPHKTKCIPDTPRIRHRHEHSAPCLASHSAN